MPLTKIEKVANITVRAINSIIITLLLVLKEPEFMHAPV
jgi:hypothetical protein